MLIAFTLKAELMVLGLNSFPNICWIHFADIEMELGMIVYNNGLQISF
jgi:hypothetical protein